MGGIFGIVDLGAPAPPPGDFEVLASAMVRWCRGRCHQRTLGGAWFGRVERRAAGESLPPSPPHQTPHVLTIATGRLDNRDELCLALDLPPAGGVAPSDEAVISAAYRRWGERCAERLLGDWAFAAWDGGPRQLVLARDQLGNASLYYTRVGERMAFASHGRALLSLPWVPSRLNEMHLARLLVVDLRAEPEDGSGTMYRDVHLLRPAHTLRATPEGERRRRYWQLDPSATAAIDSQAAGAEALIDSLRTAVRCRLRGAGGVGAMLSAGLDSTAICVLAARDLAPRHERLTAFTSVPLVDRPGTTPPDQLADEGPLAALVARSVPNIDHVLITSADVSPIAGIRTMLRIVGEPTMGATHFYWMAALLARAAHQGLGVVLRGSLGNHALSWRGASDTWLTAARRKRFGRAARLAVSPVLPAAVKRLVARCRESRPPWRPADSPWAESSAIRASFARDAGLDADTAPAVESPTAFAVRARWLDRAAWRAGVWSSDFGAAFGLSIPDPSADVRVVSLAFALPERMWQGPMPRWLFRQATSGILPDAVRLDGRRGRQAADIADRLRRHRGELAEAFAEVEASPLARHCIDVPYCRAIAAAIDGAPDPVLTFALQSILMRALGVALFLAAFERTGVVE